MESKELLFFMDACRQGHVADAEKVCELFPELVNAVDVKGYTPLIIAAYNNQQAVVDVLLRHGADPNAQDSAGNTALMGAAFRGYGPVVEQLVNMGADVNIRNGQGAPALTFAATFGQLAIAEYLLLKGASVHHRDSRGKSPLDHATLQENEEMVTLLTKYAF